MALWIPANNTLVPGILKSHGRENKKARGSAWFVPAGPPFLMKGRRESLGKTWRVVSELAPKIGIAKACRLMNVSRQGYYKWMARHNINSRTRYRAYV